MQDAGIPTARHWAVSSEADALAVLEQVNSPLVVKADGLAAGKGVTVAESIAETKAAIQEAFGGRLGRPVPSSFSRNGCRGLRCPCSHSAMESGWCCCRQPRITSDLRRAIVAPTPEGWGPTRLHHSWIRTALSRCAASCLSPPFRRCVRVESSTAA